MSYARPLHEDEFVRRHLKTQIQALALDPEMLETFLDYARREGGASAAKFRPRMYHVLNGRTPSAYIALLIADFFQKKKYEDVVRSEIDHVEYVTSDGKTKALEEFVSEHPLRLLVIRAKHYDNRRDQVSLVLRSPIRAPDCTGKTEKAETRLLNRELTKFHQWLSEQGTLPQRATLSDGQIVKVDYAPTWAEGKFIGEDHYEYRSNLSARVDITDAAAVLLFCSLKEKAPFIEPEMLDLFYELRDTLGGDWHNKTPSDYTAKQLMARFSKDASALPHAFYQARSQFPQSIATKLGKFFSRFAKKYKRLVADAQRQASKTREDVYEATPKVFRTYDEMRKDFIENLKPIVAESYSEIAAALLSVMPKEAEKAAKHFNKLQGLFGSAGNR